MHVCLIARSFFAAFMLIPNANDSILKKRREHQMKAIKMVRSYWKQAAVVSIVVSCSNGSPDDPIVNLGTEAGGDDNWGAVANAKLPDAGGGADAQPRMPENPSHISLRIPKVPKVKVTLLGGADFPYPHEIAEEGDDLIVTLYIPQGEVEDISLSLLDESSKPLGNPINLTAEVVAKMGTNKVQADGSHTIFTFEDGAQCSLDMGENWLQGPVTKEYIDGQERDVMHGIFESDVDQVCRVQWQGAQKVYAFLDGPPVCYTKPFDIHLEAGQTLGLYPEVAPETEAVQITLESP